MADHPLILASSSPRRQALLRDAGIDHELVVPDVAEDRRAGEAPAAFALRCARAKAEAVAGRFPARLVLAADTVVVLEDEVLGKPGTAERTRRMVETLSGRTHEVITGLVLMRRTPTFGREATVCSRVTFRPLTAEEIDLYVASGDGHDKAGGYGIQARGRELIAGYTGSLSNVVGLPMETLRALLKEAEAG
jgi:septum formation protein